jgi:imidazole glycerol-phosphate synthase subunit HisH
MNVVIVDYSMGNIKSIVGAMKYLGVDKVTVSNDPTKLRVADKLILPGVGSFSMAMRRIKKLKLDQYLKYEIFEQKKPTLGICLGMQLMGNSSTEDGFCSGLGFVNARVEKLSASGVKIPHVGFNQVKKNKKSKLFDEINNLSDFYFVHSYQITSDNDINQSLCEYGDNFIASYEVDNIAGVQFHPELSQTNGLKLIKNFLEKF